MKRVPSMEAYSMVEMHKKAFLKRRIHYSFFVSDKDSTMIASLRHSYHDLIVTGQIENKIDQKTKRGAKKKDNRKLPLHILPPNNFLADSNHRIRSTMKPNIESENSSTKNVHAL